MIDLLQGAVTVSGVLGYAGGREIAALPGKAQGFRGYLMGIMVSDARNIEELRRAAEQGNASAQFNLGLMYDNGEGVPEDDREAVKWYRKAAEQGNLFAQYNLGVMYAKGEGVPEDYVKAYAWVNLAAARGDEKAVEAKDRIRRRMTAEQLAEAQKLSAELFDCIESSKPE